MKGLILHSFFPKHKDDRLHSAKWIRTTEGTMWCSYYEVTLYIFVIGPQKLYKRRLGLSLSMAVF
jgi:hypothetical protein